MAHFTTACPRNCYSTCSLEVEVEQGRIRRIEPHPDNRATSGGACLKGLSYVERVVSSERILHPLRRRPGGDFERITWDDALDQMAEKLAALHRDPGPQSILYYAASGTKGLLNDVGLRFWRLYGGCTTTYGDLCWPAGLEASRLTLGCNKHSAPWDLENARLIILWGKNSAETNQHQMVFLERALEKGARMIVIDPRRTETAERASLLIQPRPGTDGALALAVAHLLVGKDVVDHEFLERHVQGYESFAERVSECSPQWAAEVTGVPVALIERLALELAERQPATIAAGFGMQRYTNSGQTMRAILALLVLTGNLGKPGAGWMFANLQSAVFDDVQSPIAFYPPERPDGVVRVGISTARLGPDMLGAKDPSLRMAWVERGNPLTQNPQSNSVREAFRALDYRVVVEQFLTDTAREADLVLPAKSLFEQSDVIGAYWHSYLQLKQKVIEPPGEVKPESEIYRLLAQRLGFEMADPGQLFPVSDQEVDAYLTRALEPFPEITLERLRRGPVLAPGTQEVAFEDLEFPTPSGKIELESSEAARRWGVDSLPGYSEPEEFARPTEGKPPRYPLTFLTPNTKNRIHSQFQNLAMIRQLGDRPALWMHPDDARARGVEDGDRVRLFNARGELRVPARLDNGTRPGCVWMTNGWWSQEGGNVNLCSAARETDMGHGAAFHDNLVEVERLS